MPYALYYIMGNVRKTINNNVVYQPLTLYPSPLMKERGKGDRLLSISKYIGLYIMIYNILCDTV